MKILVAEPLQTNGSVHVLPSTRRDLSPGPPSRTQFSGKTMGRWSLNPPAHHFLEMGSSRRLFRVCNCARHHPLARTRRCNCLAATTPSLRLFAEGNWVQAPPAPTGSTLIRVRRFNHRLTSGTGYHSGRPTPCAVIPVLHHSSHVSWTPVRPRSSGMSEAPAPA